MIALLKYGTGVPFKRLERLQEHLGMPLPATTQWDLMAAAPKLIRPVQEELIRQAAQGSVMHNDDTGMRILRLTREPGDERTGTFTAHAADASVVNCQGRLRIGVAQNITQMPSHFANQLMMATIISVFLCQFVRDV